MLRLLQGLALGGEYGGAAIYVAEHVPDNRRGYYTSFIQTTATLGLFVSLVVILGRRASRCPTARFKAWGWRMPFLLSIVLVAISLYIRLRLQESPLFAQLKTQGKTSTSHRSRTASATGEVADRSCSSSSARRPGRGSSGTRASSTRSPLQTTIAEGRPSSTRT